MHIDHICFAVKNLQEGIEYWNTAFGYRQYTAIIENGKQKVRIVFLHKEGSILIKLIEPFDTKESLMNFVNVGGGFHHLCFKCNDIHKQTEELIGKGLKLIVPPEPGDAFNNGEIAFLLAKNRLSIELIETSEKSGVLSELDK
jgi:methylmalonyl-CoA/ethylmalonyl-CoA epimerase